MNQFYFFILFLLLIPIKSLCQITDSTYVIEFTDKNGSPFSVNTPQEYLSTRAIQRRSKQNISIDVTDLPVNPSYVQKIKDAGEMTLKHTSKWLNSIVIISTDTLALDSMLQFDFVKSINKKGKSGNKITLEDKLLNVSNKTTRTVYNSELYGKSYKQLADINAHYMHQLGYYGTDIQIAVFDGGFNNVDSMDAFRNLRNNNHLLGGYDFVNHGEIKYSRHSHGTWVLSTMAGQIPNEYIGSAPDADYWLFVTEDVQNESLLEEYNWLAAAEFADSIGVDIINSSLGYTTFDDPSTNHTHEELDGKTAVISKAATYAARKGIIVVSSAGNYATNSWQKLGFPADADSILSVGAVNTDSSYANFSSVGYTADNRIKPDVSAIGNGIYVIAPNDDVFSGRGTSFSAPLVTGAVACLWQYASSATNMEIIEAIRKSAHQYDTPDSLMGYGIPNFYNAMLELSSFEENTPILSVDSLISYPNPALNEINMTYFSKNAKTVQINVVDITGKQLISSSVTVTTGPNRLKFAIDDLAIGVYNIIIFSEDEITTTTFIKE